MQGLTTYFEKIWGCRYFWLSLVRVDLRQRYRGSAFGIGWSLLQPIAMTTILCVVFSTMFGQDLTDYAPYLMAGLTFWQFLVTTSLQGCECFFTGEGYIRQHPAPMAIYPLRTMLGAAFHFTLGFLLVLVLTNICHGLGFVGVLPLLSLIPTFLLLLMFGWSLAILFGLATVRFRDLKHISEVGFQGMFYLTPIMIPPKAMESLLERRTVGWLFRLNPFAPFLDLLRAPVVSGLAPAPGMYMAALLITLFTMIAATLALKSQERKVIFYL
jgi:lipopolysaccharide transport system permease protein